MYRERTRSDTADGPATLTTYGGITTGRVTAWADALDTTPEAVVAATDAVPPLMDTGIDPKGDDKYPRSQDPAERSIAWIAGHVPDVRKAVHAVSNKANHTDR
jgi:hypothetical protein